MHRQPPEPPQGSSKRLLVVAYCFPPNADVGTQRPLRLVSYLADRGWQIAVLTPRPDQYRSGTAVDERLIERVPGGVTTVQTDVWRGITTLRNIVRHSRRQPVVLKTHTRGGAPAAQAHRVRPLNRIRTMLEELASMPDKEVGWLLPAFSKGVRTFWKAPPDVIFSTAPPWTTHLVAQSLAAIFQCPWVADFRDPWVRSPWIRYRNSVAAAAGRVLERHVVRRADAVVFTTHAARDEFAAFYGAEAARKFHVVYNGCDPTDFKRITRENGDDRFMLLHAGTLYGGRSPVALLRAVAAICNRNPDYRRRLSVRFVGSTSLPDLDLPTLCRELGLEGVVQLHPRVGREESLDEMRNASALLVIQPGTAMAIPAKLYEYLAAGRPILAICEEGEMAECIRSNGIGLIASPGDETGIERALLTLLSGTKDSFVPAHANLFDGRIRAAETAALIEAVVRPRPRAT